MKEDRSELALMHIHRKHDVSLNARRISLNGAPLLGHHVVLLSQMAREKVCHFNPPYSRSRLSKTATAERQMHDD